MRPIDADECEKYFYNHMTDAAMAGAMNAINEMPTIELCEDVVSREAVLDAIDKWVKDKSTYIALAINEGRSLLERIKALPPVTPKQKKGVWVAIDQEPHETWECDLCGFVIDGSGCIDPDEYRDIYKYCPNCGAKMQEETKA